MKISSVPMILILLIAATPVDAETINLSPRNIERNLSLLRGNNTNDYVVEGVIDLSRFGPVEKWSGNSLTFRPGSKFKIGTIELAISVSEIHIVDSTESSPLLFYTFDSKEFPRKQEKATDGKNGITPSGDGRDGAHGGNGAHGSEGIAGKDGGTLLIKVSGKSPVPPFSVDLNGQDGGPGADGGHGGNGDKGNRGRRASDGAISCRRGGGNGGRGGNGGDGGDAGAGGRPGDGGRFAILADQSSVSLVGELSKRGAAGKPGREGVGAGGGSGGRGSTYCRGGSGGPRGTNGVSGRIPEPRHPARGTETISLF